MPTFNYESLTQSGQVTTGVVEAPDRASAMRLLMQRGETPTALTGSNGTAVATIPVKSERRRTSVPVSAASEFTRKRRPTLKRSEMANLIRELATALEAGLPLMQALRTMRRSARGRALPEILDHLIDRIEAGTPLHQAAKEYGRPFDDMIIGMMRAADASGRMNEVLHQLADLLDRSLELRRAMVSATIYPGIVLLLLIGSALVLVTYLVPNLLAPLAGQIELPWPTVVVLAVADFIGSYGLLIVLLGIVSFFGFRAWLKQPENRITFDRWRLSIPAYGRLIRMAAVARMTRTLGTLASAGLPILDSLRITADTLGNAAMTAAIEDVQHMVSTGKPLAEPLEKSGLFPPLLVQIVNLGERSGRLEPMLMHAAGAFDRDVQNNIKIFTALLQPLLIVIMAIFGGFLLAAILLPLLELQNTIG